MSTKNPNLEEINSAYQSTITLSTSQRLHLAGYRASLKAAGFSPAEIKRITDPIESFHRQIQEEPESNEGQR